MKWCQGQFAGGAGTMGSDTGRQRQRESQTPSAAWIVDIFTVSFLYQAGGGRGSLVQAYLMEVLRSCPLSKLYLLLEIL